jgi:hypothetical protein
VRGGVEPERAEKGVDMEEHQVETSPQVLSRIGGVLYLIIIVLGLFNEAFVRNRIVVSGDATATAANIRSLESLWRFGIAAEFFMLICAISLTLIFFVLLRPVSKELALLAVFFNLVSIAVEASVQLYLLGACFRWAVLNISKRSRRSSSTPWRACRSNRMAMALALP